MTPHPFPLGRGGEPSGSDKSSDALGSPRNRAIASKSYALTMLHEEAYASISDLSANRRQLSALLFVASRKEE
jgi:hypothetical protein